MLASPVTAAAAAASPPVSAGKVHGSLARAGKVRGQTPKVPKQEKKKQVEYGAGMRYSVAWETGVAALP